jgi:hypothetical protein
MTEEDTTTQPTASEEIPQVSSFGTVLYEWESFNDVSSERTANWTAAMIFLQFLFLLFSLITAQWFLLLILIAILVVTILISKYEGKKTTNQITSLGIVVGDRTRKWSSLGTFWIQEDPFHCVIGFQPTGKFSLPEIVFVDGEDVDQIVRYIAQYLPQEDKQISLIDILINTLGFNVRKIYTLVLERLSLTKKE